MKNNHLIVFLLIGLFTSGCATVYLPTAADAPMHSNAGEFQAAGYAGVNGFEMHSSYAFTQHFAAGLNGTIIDRTDLDGDRTYHRLAEVRASYFTTFGTEGRGRIELKVGYGRGGVFAESSKFSNYTIATNYNRFTIAQFIGRSSEYVEGGITPRFTFIQYTDPGARRVIPYFEPISVVKVGPPGFKFMSQFGFSIPLSITHDWAWHYMPFVTTIGIEMKLGLNKE